MISLKRYLDQGIGELSDEEAEDRICDAVLVAYCAALAQMGECGTDTCPTLAPELARGLKRISDSLEQSPNRERVIESKIAVRELLRTWGRGVASYYEQKASDVKDLLLVMSRTAESLGNKDERIARKIENVSEQLNSIVTLDDVSRIRASIESSARELRESLTRMTAEGKALMEHLRAEVSTYQTKLEKAERVSSSDSLTGLGSRHWVEGRIQERIGSDRRFSIVLIDIAGFHGVVETHGNLVGDLLLKEFAGELRSVCRFTDIVGRWGSDEFIIVLDDVGSEVVSHVSRLRASMSKRYHVPGRTGYVNVPLVVSVGMAEYQAGDDLQELLERADSELCRELSCRVEQKTA